MQQVAPADDLSMHYSDYNISWVIYFDKTTYYNRKSGDGGGGGGPLVLVKLTSQICTNKRYVALINGFDVTVTLIGWRELIYFFVVIERKLIGNAENPLLNGSLL